MKSLITCISFFGLLSSAAPTWNLLDLFHEHRDVSLARRATETTYTSCIKHPTQKKCQPVPIDYSFEVTVPVIPEHFEAPAVNYGGYHFKLPKQAFSGLLVSFFGNFDANETMSSQTQTIAAQSTSTSITGGVSMSNATATANETTIVAVTFSSGDASSTPNSAAASAQTNVSVTSTSSSGSANSQASAIASADGTVAITTSANLSDSAVANAQSVQNEQQAAAATSCVAQNSGASASAEEITSVQFTTANGTTVTSVAFAACEAGLLAPAEMSAATSSSSGSVASVNGVSATVVCDGVESTNRRVSTTFRVRVLGVWSPLMGFTGAMFGQRVQDAEASC
ncbi:hypothetical protein LTS10_011111 [Elasticomyces elasticus]|nr:hypothetical protein LTS10_011111 [Elasticomyces elasticus]